MAPLRGGGRITALSGSGALRAEGWFLGGNGIKREAFPLPPRGGGLPARSAGHSGGSDASAAHRGSEASAAYL
jgi:hypothetical protein